MHSWKRIVLHLALLGLFPLSTQSSTQAETFLFHASQSGKPTLDQGEGGGNPFASALIELLQRPSLSLQELPAALRQMTEKKSRGFQSPDGPMEMPVESLALVPPAKSGQRIALVLVVSDYRLSNGAQSLPGARHDAERVASAFQRAGLMAEVALDLGLDGMRAKLAEFGDRSRRADLALIYVTGHGIEVGGKVFLLPGNYPVKERDAALDNSALALSEVALAPHATQANLVFYAGCRDNPFEQ